MISQDFKIVVDVGGGQGTLLATILRKNPKLQGVLLDMPHVVEMARPMLEREGLQARCKLAPGNFFEAVPGGGDLYMLKRILHDWDDKNSREILMTCRAAMSAELTLIVLDAVVPVGNTPVIFQAPRFAYACLCRRSREDGGGASLGA